ncbi:MAG TPA: tRNA (N6-isopentenyl adenosine(37)-C2)-methylthiotransferase MiaB [bacterium]|nr:tRNA (N6-isopentenyl adenosine(37)-C2)-methylthiotransferase MiaB [bacterium]
MKKYFIKTYGCQMNEQDSSKMEALLGKDGYVRASSAAEADVVVLNTCSVREKSYHKAVSHIARMKQAGEAKVLAVTGCVVSHSGDAILKRFPQVDMVLGPDHVAALPELARKAKEGGGRFSRIDFSDLSDYEFPSPIVTDQRQVKAYVTIMKGCDNACSFCIVPFTRGAEVSRRPEEIIDEINRLSAQGVREVMLLGQNVNSYGKGLTPQSQKTSFARLLRQVDEETSIDRLRFTSPHPKDLSPALIEEYARNRKLCPHMHLPVQSGSSRVLKRMRRSYTRGTYLRRVEDLRRVVPDVAITADIIVGFPGETEADFEETLSLVREVGYDASYCFAYSRRPGTEAAGFPDDVPPESKKERLDRLQILQAEISLAKNRQRIGRIEDVLAEGPSADGHGQLMGRTPHGRIVNFDGGPERTGDILKIEVTDASPYSLKGRVSDKEAVVGSTH